MSADSFLKKWNACGTQKQLLTLLLGSLKQANGELRIPLNTLMEIEDGETLALSVEENSLVLRYSPEHTQLYTIQEQSWPKGNQQTTPYQVSQSQAILTDDHLAELELKAQRAAEVREEARRRRTEPVFQTKSSN